MPPPMPPPMPHTPAPPRRHRRHRRRFMLLGLAAAGLSGCGLATIPPSSADSGTGARVQRLSPIARANAAYDRPLYPNETPQLRALIVKYATLYEVPVELVQRQIVRESTHRPWVRNGPYYGLMQILPATARSMGFTGQPEELLDAQTNLKYAVKYLRGAWIVSGGDMDAAVMWYARGYYYEAKRLGLLEETGLR